MPTRNALPRTRTTQLKWQCPLADARHSLRTGGIVRWLASSLRRMNYFEKMIRLFYYAAVLVGVAAPCACGFAQEAPAKPAPDVLVFVNGDQLKGTLIRGVGKEIVFKSEMAGELTVSLDKVKELRSAESFAVLTKDMPVLQQKVDPGNVVVEDGSVTVTSRVDFIRTVPVKDVGYIIDSAKYEHELLERPRFYQGFTGTVAAGITLVRATQNNSVFTGGVNLVQSLPLVPFLPRISRTTLNLTESYGKQTQPVIPQTTPASPDLITKTDIFHTDLERDHYFSPRFYALAQTAFDHNFSQGLDLQQLYGAGFGTTLLQTPVQQLDLKADVHYEKQQFETAGSDQNLIGSLMAETYHRNLPRRVILTQTFSILPAWNNLNAYSANGFIGLALPVFQRLALTVNATDNFINNPAIGFQKNSLQFVTGISYTLR